MDKKNDGIGIPLNEYVKNDLKENEKIEKIDFAKDENAIRYTITDDKNNERLIFYSFYHIYLIFLFHFLKFHNKYK